MFKKSKSKIKQKKNTASSALKSMGSRGRKKNTLRYGRGWVGAFKKGFTKSMFKKA